MVAIRTVKITNVSTQAVNVMYSNIDAAKSVTSVAAADAGSLTILPARNVTIEQSRVDMGQLEAMRNRGLIVFTVVT